MKQSIKHFPIYVLAVSILILASAFFAMKGADLASGKLTSNPNAYTSASMTSSTVGDSAVQVLARNTDRNFAECVNRTSTVVYCAKNATSTGVSTSTALYTAANGGSHTFDVNDPYLGALWCLTNTGTSSVVCEENE